MKETRAHYVIDRFEDQEWAVLERDDGLTFNVPLGWLPEEAQEGHVLGLSFERGKKISTLHLFLDAEETRRRLEGARERREGLPKGPQGDIEL